MLWPEVLKFMFECANSPDSGLRESALHIFRLVRSQDFYFLFWGNFTFHAQSNSVV